MFIIKAYLNGRVVLESYFPIDITQNVFDMIVEGFTEAAAKLGATDVVVN